MAQDAAVGQAIAAFNPVRYTRRASRASTRGRTRVRDVFVDVYSALLAVGTVGALAAGLVLALREQVAQAWDADPAGRTLVVSPSFSLPEGAAPTVLLFAALVTMLGMARKFGPAAVAPAEGYWWLSLPVDRRPMIAGRLVRRLLLVWAGAAVLYLPIGFLSDLQASVPGQFLGAGAFGLAAACAVMIAVLQQAGMGSGPGPGQSGSGRTGSGRTGSGRTGSGRPSPGPERRLPPGTLPGIAVLALVSLIPLRVASGSWGLMGTVLGVTGALWLLTSSRLDRIPGRELIRGGAVSGHAGAAIFLMDPNELGRALTSGSGADPKLSHRARRWYAQEARTPFGALLRADTAAFLRTPGWRARPVLILLLCAALLLAGGTQPVPLQLALIAAAVCATVPAAGVLARRTAITPGLDMLLPLSPAAVRLSRMVMPAAVLSVWTALFAGTLVLLGIGSPELIGLGALAGLGFGAAAVRGAYRPQPDWTAPPTETVFGPVPTAQTGSMIRGLDTTLLALVPLLLGLFLGYVPGVLLLAQAGVSAVCVLVVMYSTPK